MGSARDASYAALSVIMQAIHDGNISEARDRAIIERERHEFDPESRDTELLNLALKAVGLFPYIVAPEQQLSILDALAYEANRVQLGKSSIVLHSEQEAAYLTLLDGENLVLSAPTSFGKTVLLDAYLNTKRPRCAVIIVPTIALLDEIRRRLQRTLDGYTFVTQSTATPGSRTVYILTQERYLELETPPKPDFFMIDEFYKLDPHQLTESNDRTLTLNLCFKSLLKSNAQFLLSGPPIKRLSSNFTSTINAKQHITDFSPVRQIVEDRSATVRTEDDRRKDLKLTLHDQNPGKTLIFCKSPKAAEDLAHSLIPDGLQQQSQIVLLFADWLAQQYGAEWSIPENLKSGIGVHHGQLPRALQRAILRLYNDDTLSTLTCTSTIIEGVNTATQTVVVYDKKLGKSAKLDAFTFANIAGRAGRMSRYYTGKVITYACPPSGDGLIIDPPIVSKDDDMPEEYLVQLPEPELDSSELKSKRNRVLSDFNVPDALAYSLVGRDISKCGKLYSYLNGLNNESFQELWTSTIPSDSVLYKIVKAIRQTLHVDTDKQVNRLWKQYKCARDNPYDMKAEITDRLEYESNDYDKACRAAFSFHRNMLSFRLPRDFGSFQIVYNYEAVRRGLPEINLDPVIRFVSCEFLPPYITTLEEYGIPTSIAMQLRSYGYSPATSDEDIQSAVDATLRYLSKRSCSRIDRWFLEDFLDGVGMAHRVQGRFSTAEHDDDQSGRMQDEQ
mgnify:CR=1 FL=1